MYEIDPGRVCSPRDDENPSFDLGPRSRPLHNNNNRGGKPRNTPAMDLDKMTTEDIQSVIKLKPQPKQTWEPDVKSMISTKKWLSTYGLRRNRLSLDQILGSIGFKHSDDYDHSLKKPVCSRYGEGMFTKYPRKDGTVYNVNLRVSKEKIQQIENSLLQAIALYKRRIEWLTSESRRLFGVIEERCISIVLDIKTNSPSQFGHCRNAVIRVLEEQVSQVAKFNIIRAAEDQVVFSEDGAIPISHDSLNNAIDWLSKLDSVAATTSTSACEGVLKAFDDHKVDAVYLFSEGSSANTATELLLSKVRGGPLPIHTVAFNNSDSTTIKFLKEVAQATGGRFHAFAFNKLESDVSGTSGYNMDNKILQGGVPPGAGARDDVVKMWAELEEARNILVDIQQLCKEAPSNGKSEQSATPMGSLESSGSGSNLVSADREENEQYMGSRGWIAKRGLNARKLGYYDVLATCSFRHCDGIVDVKTAPDADFTDAESRNMLINAKYCDRFCHVQWKDGSVKHVHVTAEVHREYEKKMSSALDDFQRRIDWLQQGSRELFGTIIEDQVYILIDVSNSMENHLGLVKEKIYRLMQEQLRHKQRFNFVHFGSKAMSWRDRMLEVNETNMQGAWQWVRNLNVSGSTNTLAALKIALSDPHTQAVYLLTDGRPDHPPKTILAQVQLKEPIPIHAISFNCNDSEANDFLALLAADTGGRYHYFSTNAMMEHRGPTPYESEDVRLLKEEVKKGRDDLQKLADLRVQCAMLDWGNKTNKQNAGCGKDHGIKKRPSSASSGLRSASQILSRDSSSPTPPRLTRPMSAQSNRRPMSALSTTSHERCRTGRSRTTTYPPRPSTPTRRSAPNMRPNVAYHSRTSWFRLHMIDSGHLVHDGFIKRSGKFNEKYTRDHNKTSWLRLRGSLDGWAVPETRAMLAKQQERYVAAVQDLAQVKSSSEKKKKKKKVDPLSMSSKMWLKKHGLAAKNLTIYDALGNTMVKQRSKYIPILDKHVTSQVFNEILPLAHVTGNRREISLINPSGIDLVGYEEKLEKAIELYHKRLDRIVWNALSRDEKEQYNEDDEPVSFMEYRKDCIEALDRLGWPVSERNILLLEDEIEKGKRYLRHSRAIQRALKAKYEDKSPERSPSAMSSPSRSAATTPRTSHLSRRKSNLGDSDASSHSSGSKHGGSSGSESEEEQRSRKDSDAEERDHHSNSSDEEKEEQREKYKDVVKRKGGHGSKKKTTQSSKKTSTKRSRPKTPSIRLPVGSKVIARSAEDGFYYPGTVSRAEDSRHVRIRFQSQGPKVVPTRFVIQMGGARPSPILRTGDSVLVRVSRHHQETWVPAIIQFGPADEGRASAKFYTVVLYNYKKMSVSRSGVVKIPHERYNFTVRFICSLSDTPEESETIEEPTIIDLEEESDEDYDDKDKTSSDEEDSSDEEERSDEDQRRTPENKTDEESAEYEKRTPREKSRARRDRRRRKHKLKSEDRKKESDQLDKNDDFVDGPSAPIDANDDIHKKLLELQQQMEEYHTEQNSTQQKLRDELNESIALNQEIVDLQRKHDDLSKEHKKLRHQHDKMGRRHHRLQKRHLKLKGERDATPGQSESKDLPDEVAKNKKRTEELESQLAEVHKQMQELNTKLGNGAQVDLSGDEEEQEQKQGEATNSTTVDEKPGEPNDGEAEDKPNGKEDNTEANEEDKAKEADKEEDKSSINKGDEVLALSSEDGWFYRGTVEKLDQGDEYLIVDDQDNIIKVPRKYILTEEEDAGKQIKANDKVVALHPEYAAQYGPATVFKVLHDLWYQVGFYDNTMAEVPREEMYVVTPDICEEVKEAILVHEDKLVDRPVVARKDEDGIYYLGTVKERIGRGREFTLEWPDEKQCQQHWRHIFGAYSKRRQRLVAGDFVLAVADEAKMVYLPGKVTGSSGTKITVEFCNKTKSDKVDAVQSFWLSEGYYHEANIFYAQSQKKLFGSILSMEPKPMGSTSSLKTAAKSVFGKIANKLKSSSSSSSSSSDSEKEVQMKDADSDEESEEEQDKKLVEQMADDDNGTINGDDMRSNQPKPMGSSSSLKSTDSKSIFEKIADKFKSSSSSSSSSSDSGSEKEGKKAKKVAQEEDDDW